MKYDGESEAEFNVILPALPLGSLNEGHLKRNGNSVRLLVTRPKYEEFGYTKHLLSPFKTFIFWTKYIERKKNL